MEQTLEIIGTIVGLVYLWLEYRASIYLWIAGIIMPAVYIFVYYDAGLYADFGINIYYLGAAIYGWMMWKYRAVLRRTILKRKMTPQTGREQQNRRTKAGAFHYLYADALLAAAYCRIHRRLPRHCLDIDKLHGQQCALAGLLHHRTEHRRHVDAGTEICRTMVGMDCGRCRQRRTVHLQRT